MLDCVKSASKVPTVFCRVAILCKRLGVSKRGVGSVLGSTGVIVGEDFVAFISGMVSSETK